MIHVLVADDEPHTRLTLSFILESAGYLVTDAPDGREALRKILALEKSPNPVDALVLDVEMPGLNGWELLNELQERRILLPTIIITGCSDVQTRGSPLEEGHWELILKPFTPERLTATISNLLQTPGR